MNTYNNYPEPGSQTLWYTQTTLELRLGAYARLTNRLWADITIDAPTGHSLYYVATESNQDAQHKFFNNTYHAALPKVQLGISYQIH